MTMTTETAALAAEVRALRDTQQVIDALYRFAAGQEAWQAGDDSAYAVEMAEAAGIATFAWKLRAIMLSGAIAGATGAFYAVVLLVVTPPSVFGMLVSAQALTVVMFGGVGTVWGPVIGAAILIPSLRERSEAPSDDEPGGPSA